MRALPGRQGEFWPTDEEERLLRASLGTGAELHRAWHELEPQFSVCGTRGDSARLLPLLYLRLLELGVTHPDLPRMKNLHRFTWFENERRLYVLERAIRVLDAAGIATMVLKGAALATQVYGDVGSRPMSDLDVLVPTAERHRALRVLADDGWRSQAGEGSHAVMLERGDSTLDLHWQVRPELVIPGRWTESCDDFWAAAVAIDIRDTSTRMLCPTDALLHVCVHGTIVFADAHVHWAADAMTLLRAAGPDLDWDRFLEQTRLRHVVLPVRETLRYLADRLDAPVPVRVLEALQDARVSRRDRLVFRARSVQVHSLGARGTIGRGLTWCISETAELPLAKAVAALPAVLRRGWGVESNWQLLAVAARRLTGALTAARRSTT